MENNLLRIGILMLVGLILYNILMQSGMLGKMGGNEEMTGRNADLKMVMNNAYVGDGPDYNVSGAVRPHQEENSQLYDHNHEVLPYPQISTSPQDSQFNSGGACQSSDPGCYSGSVLQAPDLLPQGTEENAWSETSPEAQGHITDQNFLESGHHYGINTVGQSLKNANRQLRNDPSIPKVQISPWNNSTVQQDTNKRGFEIA